MRGKPRMDQKQIARVLNLMATNRYEVGILRVARVVGDRGTLVVDGAGSRLMPNDPCPFCNQVGHVYYPGMVELVAETKVGRKWYVHASCNTGDAIVECPWCGVSHAQYEVWGIEETEAREKQFRKDYPKKHGYRVRNEARK